MKRRDQGISNAWSFLLGFVILTIVVPGVLIGPAKAIRMIASAVSGTVMQHSDPDVEVKKEHQLKVIELRSKEQELIYNTVHFPIELEDDDRNGILVNFRSQAITPFPPYEQIVLRAPGDELLEGTLALWIAGGMGVPIPQHELIYLRRDGNDAGIHELSEYVSASFELYRNISNGPVTVIRPKSDLEPAIDPWASLDHWELSMAQNEDAKKSFGSLIGILNDSLISNADRRIALDLVIDVESFNRYHACTLVLGVNDRSQMQMALVLNPRTAKFYPVLMKGILLPASDEVIISTELDLLAQRMLAISDWRVQRDDLVKEALQQLHVNGSFQKKADDLAEHIGPSLTTVGRSRKPLFSMSDQAGSAASLEWSAGDLTTRVASYWDRTMPVVSGGTGAPILTEQ